MKQTREASVSTNALCVSGLVSQVVFCHEKELKVWENEKCLRITFLKVHSLRLWWQQFRETIQQLETTSERSPQKRRNDLL
jgi:hypothetical protein